MFRNEWREVRGGRRGEGESKEKEEKIIRRERRRQGRGKVCVLFLLFLPWIFMTGHLLAISLPLDKLPN